MPYVLDEDRDKNQQASSGAVSTGGGLSTTPAGPGAGNAPQQGGTGKFVNFDRIFQANQKSANQMAGQVEGNINNAAQGIKNDVDQKRTGFTDAVVGGVQQNPGATWTAKGQPYGTWGANQSVYNGPASWGDYSGADWQKQTQEKGQTVKDQLGATSSYEGLQALLQDQHGKGGNYTQGMSAWDAALTGTAGMGNFDALRQKWSGLDGILTSAVGADLGGMVPSAQAGVDQLNVDSAGTADGLNANLDEKRRLDAQSEEAAKAQRAADEKEAHKRGLYDQWVAAGSPPFQQWYADWYAKTKGGS
jgi:hypothetical protein